MAYDGGLDLDNVGVEMNPQFVTFEQAKLLKELGFDVQVEYQWVHNTTEPLDDEYYTRSTTKLNHNKYPNYISAPEIWQVIEWLETNFQKYIYAFRYNGEWQYKIDAEHGCDYFSKGADYKSRKNAYIAAIDYTLNNLI